MLFQEKIAFFAEKPMFDLGGWNVGFWLMVVIDIAAVAVLGLAIAYSSHMWRKRRQDPRTVKASDEATLFPYTTLFRSDRKSVV